MSNKQSAIGHEHLALSILSIAHCMLTIFILMVTLPAGSQHTLMRSYNINDGLVSNQVRGFYQDKRGFIWIMTWEGVSRHDGSIFRNYTVTEGLAHPLINAMIETDNDKIYIAENDGSLDIIRNGEVQKDLRKKYKDPINKFIPETSGRMLAPSDNLGICIFMDGAVTSLNTSGTPISTNEVIPDRDYFFVCGSENGVMGQDYHFLKMWDDSIVEYNCMLKDHHGQIWIGTSIGLRWVNLSSPPPAQFELIMTAYDKTKWGNWVIRDLLQTSDGSIWIAAIGGLIQIKPDQSWRLYDRFDGLPSDYLTSLFEDQTGFLWIGTDQGAARLDIHNTIDIHTISEHLPNSLPSEILPTSDGGAYVIYNKAAMFKLHANNTIQPIEIGKHERLYEFLIAEDDTLVTTDKARYKLIDNNVKLWSKKPFTLSVFSIRMSNGCICSSSFNDITVSCPTGSVTDTIMNDMIYAIAEDKKGDLWFATLSNGVHRARVSKNASGKMELTWRDFSDDLPEQTIRSLHIDGNGNIWIGTRYSGLVQLSYDTVTEKYATHIFDRSDGFISDFITSIASDAEGNIWVGTHAGIEKLIPSEDGYRIFSFSKVHHFFATVIKLAIGPDYTIWCITTSGVVRIRDNRYENTPPSHVYITSVSTSKQKLLDPQNQLPFDLTYKQNFMDIEFSSNDHINGKQIKYSYHLAGSQDTSWSKPSPEHKVSFASLLPGRYSFEVRVLGWNGLLGEKTSYTFRVLPPFWQQTWFVTLSILSFLALLFSFYRYRISQLRRIQDVRNRIASDLHDEIGSSLTHVNILSEIGRKTSAEEGQSQQLFKRIGEEVQSSSEALDDIIWSVSSRADTAEDLISRMRRYASELLDAKGISFSLLDDHVDEHQTLGLELRRDFYLIYKELLRNVIRHAEATEVRMRIHEANHFLWLEITDNGHGFDPGASTERQGLHSIKGRVTKWKGHISIESSPASGTVIKVGLPVKTSLSLRNG